MVARPLSPLFSRSSYICPSCARRAQTGLRPPSATFQKRSITQRYLQKTLEAKLEWARQATEIKAGRKESMLTILEKRGYVNQIVGERDDLDNLMIQKRIGVYVGVDPTAPSLHVGHLLPLMVLYWMYIHGFHTCSLLGGATAKIGDPTWRTAAREGQHSTIRKLNMTKMHFQLKSMWMHVEKRANGYGYKWEWAWTRELTNNNTWLNKLSVMDILQILGSGVRMGTMLGRDTVKTRMKQGEGMSFAEFSYPILQSWDWWYMYQTKDIQVQVGGSDQFGNILAGIDAINYVRLNHTNPDVRQVEKDMSEKEKFLKKPMGFTVPLLTTSSGEKFGKSAGNAVWLDAEMTSPFELYQFFLRTADADVHRYLKLFTFEPLDALEVLIEEHSQDPSKRVAQRKLAREVTIIVHGEQALQEAEEETGLLFKKHHVRSEEPILDRWGKPPDINSSLNKNAPQTNSENAPFHSLVLPKSLVYDQQISRVLYHAGLVASRSEGHRLVAKKGAYLGSRPGSSGTMADQVDFSPAANWDGKETAKYIIGDDTLILRVGKWKVKIIKIISDEEFEQQGLTAPGWKEERPEPKKLDKGVQEMKPWHKKQYLEKSPMHKSKGSDVVDPEERFSMGTFKP